MSEIRHQPSAPTRTRALAGGDVIDRHRHDDHQLVYVSTGVIAIRTEHGSWVASNDRALWIPAGVWHEHRSYGTTSFHSVGDQRLVDACRIVEDDLRRPRSLGWLARQVNTSERTPSRLFRSELAMTYRQWRTRSRVFAATIMLAEGATVTETGYACGWATTSAFVETFARTVGSTPGAHRRV